MTQYKRNFDEIQNEIGKRMPHGDDILKYVQVLETKVKMLAVLPSNKVRILVNVARYGNEVSTIEVIDPSGICVIRSESRDVSIPGIVCEVESLINGFSSRRGTDYTIAVDASPLGIAIQSELRSMGFSVTEARIDIELSRRLDVL